MWKIAFVSESVELAAIDDWMLEVQDTKTPFNKPIVDCIDLLSGNIFAKAASTWYVHVDFVFYVDSCCFDHLYVTNSSGPIDFAG